MQEAGENGSDGDNGEWAQVEGHFLLQQVLVFEALVDEGEVQADGGRDFKDGDPHRWQLSVGEPNAAGQRRDQESNLWVHRDAIHRLLLVDLYKEEHIAQLCD